MARAGRAADRRACGDRAARAPGRGAPAGERRVNLLGFDTATAATSACLLRGDDSAFEVVPEPAALAAPPAHAAELLPALAEVLARAELDWADVDAIAVGTG